MEKFNPEISADSEPHPGVLVLDPKTARPAVEPYPKCAAR